MGYKSEAHSRKQNRQTWNTMQITADFLFEWTGLKLETGRVWLKQEVKVEFVVLRVNERDSMASQFLF